MILRSYSIRELRVLINTALLSASIFLVGQSSFACQICIPYPRKSAADFILESDALIFAREDPERPFHFAPTEILQGDPGTEPIDLFLDSSTRRLLTTYPDQSILLGKQNTGDEPGWRRIGTVNEETDSLIRKILENAEAWQESPDKRVTFFAGYLDSDEPQIRALAHLELARAPYSEIRKYGDALPRETIHAFLNNTRYMEWHALYILLLAQSTEPEDQKRIRDAMEVASRFSTGTNLSAWATALVETDRAEGITFLVRNYLGNPDRTSKELQAVCAALSVQGSGGNPALRDSIVDAYRTALSTHPELAPILVNDLIAWKRFDLAEPIEQLAKSRPPLFDLTSTLKLRGYVRRKLSPSASPP